MTSPPAKRPPGSPRFRTQLLVAMMLVVSVVTASGLWFAQRSAVAGARRELQREFHGELAALHVAQEIRHAALAERCRALARKPRIHATLEDNALDLLYPSARDELADVMAAAEPVAREPAAYGFHAKFYRFLESGGAVIPASDARDVGTLGDGESTRLALHGLSRQAQLGYVWRTTSAADRTIDEVIAMPIVSTETGEVIAALILGFDPWVPGGGRVGAGFLGGIWLDGRLQLPSLDAAIRAELEARVAQLVSVPGPNDDGQGVEVGGTPYVLFHTRLNPNSIFPPAYEVCLYPLTEALTRQSRLRRQFAGAGAVLLLGALGISHLLSRRLSRPVEKLALDSEENRTQRARAEAALEMTHGELQRAARFSADASHQLKTPVTVLRAGLEDLLAGEPLSANVREQVSSLVHQTFRLTSVIEDLLLLSRMDAGRLRIEFKPVDLTRLIDSWADDINAVSDDLNPAVETEVPPGLHVSGEQRYLALIMQNLLENARKYNCPGGRIRITARANAPWVVLTVGNTGRPIPPDAQAHIFERFHRGSAGENIPGHGLGLNLARELARLHHGDLRLARSEGNWTEFEARFRLALPAPATAQDLP